MSSDYNLVAMLTYCFQDQIRNKIECLLNNLMNDISYKLGCENLWACHPEQSQSKTT